jgi:glycosyltransferase involved in cell wall biosynthesis
MSSFSSSAPGVTVVTAVRNGRATLEDTIRTVLAQTYPGVEHVVVDAASTDGTQEMLAGCGARVRWVSERDLGPYDGMNKGIGMVEDPSRYIVILNADDMFHAPDAVERMMSGSAGEDFLYGRLERFDEELNYRDVIGREVRGRKLLYGMRCHHQTVFCRRAVFDRIGRFDLQYRIAADYDWVLRAFHDPGVSRRFVPVTVATMRRGGLSDVRYPESARERWRIVRQRFPSVDLVRYTLWTGFGDYGRFWLQQALKRVGLLNALRRTAKAVRR